MSREDVISGSLVFLGFGRAKSKSSGTLDERIGSLAAKRQLQVVDGVVTTAGVSA